MSEPRRKNVFGNHLNMAHVLANSPPALDQVLPGLVAGTVGMLAGPGGVGKTMLELQLSISLAAGLTQHDDLLGPDWGSELLAKPCRVLFIAAEEPAEVVWGRVHHIVHSLNQRHVLPEDMTWADFQVLLEQNLCIYPLGGDERIQLIDESLSTTQHMQDLHAIAEGARLVILDPLRQFHLEDENNSGAMSALVSAFKRLARRSGGAVLFAHHTNRAAAQYGFAGSAEAARGSTALTADVRWQMNIAAPSKEQLKRYGLKEDAVEQHVLLHSAKGNYQAHRHPVLMRRTAGGVLVPAESMRSQKASRRTH